MWIRQWSNKAISGAIIPQRKLEFKKKIGIENRKEKEQEKKKKKEKKRISYLTIINFNKPLGTSQEETQERRREMLSLDNQFCKRIFGETEARKHV